MFAPPDDSKPSLPLDSKPSPFPMSKPATDTPVRTAKTVPDRLTALGDLFRERNKLYGSNYKNFGATLLGLFPSGITLRTAEDFNRFALFLQVVHKVTRYARAMPAKGHADSCDDMAVYAQMMAECDDDHKNKA